MAVVQRLVMNPQPFRFAIQLKLKILVRLFMPSIGITLTWLGLWHNNRMRDKKSPPCEE